MPSLRRIITYLRPYKSWVLIAFSLVVVESLSELAIPRLLQNVIDHGITPKVLSVIISGSGLMLVAALIGGIATVIRAIYSARFSQGMAYDLRNDIFTRIQTLSFGNLDRLQTGQLITRVSSDVDIVRMFSSLGLMMILRATVLMFGSLTLLVITDPQLSLIMLVLIPAIASIFYILAKVARPLFKLVQERLDDLNTIVQENLAGVQVVKAFVREDEQIDQFEDANLAYKQRAIKVFRLMGSAFPVVLFVGNAGILAVILFGGIQVINARLSVGELVAFSNYLMTSTFPIVMLGMIISMMPSAEASAERIFGVLDTEPDIKEALNPIELPKISGNVCYENVSFFYNGNSEQKVLGNINLEIKNGQRVAVLGATGSGKTTLLSLIPRYYDVSAGKLLVDGYDIRKVDIQSLRSQIGFVMQQTTLFSGTVAENIAYGRPDASMQEIIAAAEAAQAHDFIITMPEGYQSQVEARGANLSGGQKQRIAIARALLIDPAILILDDSTSSVDMETEFRIQEALDDLMEGRTTFIIAQRISSVLKADLIIILERGEIVARGSHAELIESCSIYQEIYRSQLRDDIPIEKIVSAEETIMQEGR
jgi:ATP-binding cassette, subfamily B, multidrug efflux pump